MEKGEEYRAGGRRKRKRHPAWDAERVRGLRRRLGLSQDELADELGTRQQTISEWETGRYQPRGASARLLAIVAERVGFEYGEEEGGRRKKEGGRKEEGGRRKEEGGRRKKEGGRRKEEGGRRKEVRGER